MLLLRVEEMATAMMNNGMWWVKTRKEVCVSVAVVAESMIQRYMGRNACLGSAVYEARD